MISEATMDTSHILDIHATRLRWSDQLRSLRYSIRFQFRRLRRQESRMYLTVDGFVLARFTSERTEMLFRDWLAGSHLVSFETGANFSEGIARALNSQADADRPGPA